MDIKKLLFVTDFEELWFDALQSLLDLKRAALNHVVFLNVIRREKVALRRGAGYQKEEEIKLREKANIRFIDWAEILFEQGMEVGVYIVVGGFAQKVIESVRKEEIDLVVIGRQKKGALEQLYSGSDIREIAKRAQVPVLVYKYAVKEGQTGDKPFSRPILATNWTPGCESAVGYLKRLTGIIDQIDLVHVASEKSLKSSSAMAIQKTRKETRQRLDEIGDVFEASGIRARSHVYIGDPVKEIEKATQECQATMLVIGLPEKDSWKDKLSGSTFLSLAERPNIPTLLVPHKQKESEAAER
jgi:nucleotide-binding universal stress UspA family protein